MPFLLTAPSRCRCPTARLGQPALLMPARASYPRTVPFSAASSPIRLQRVSVYGLARTSDAVLMVQIGPDPHGDTGKWMLPGGGVEHGEHPCAAVIREMLGETGYAVAVDRLLEVGSDHRLLPSGIDFHGVFIL